MNALVKKLNTKIEFSALNLKYIAIIAMFIDHFAWLFVNTNSVLGQLMHSIGRLTAPIMCFFIAEGYYKTSNIKKYLFRLGLFAVISILPFSFCFYNLTMIRLGMIYSLFLGLVALIILKNKKIDIFLKILSFILILYLSTFGDWAFYSVIYVCIFGMTKDNFKLSAILFSIATFVQNLLMFSPSIDFEDNLFNPNIIFTNIFNLAIYLALIPLSMYNGKLSNNENYKVSKKKANFHKLFFYIFYPAHLLLLGFIKNILLP